MVNEPLHTWQEIVAGDDYKAADGRALTWTVPSAPNLAGASLEMIVGHDDSEIYGDLPITWKGTVPSSPAEPTSIALELTAAESAQIAEGMFDYILRATLVNGDKVTVAVGNLSVIYPPGIAPLMPT